MWSDILFDLDGTLTDPGEGIMGSVRHALEAGRHPVPDEEVLRGFIGPSLHDSFSEVCGLDAAQTEAAVEAYRLYFSATGIHQNFIFPGMAALLRALKQEGRRLYLATAKPLYLARQILDRFEIADLFTYTAGSHSVGPGRPKGEVVAEVLQAANVHRDSAVMVGDRLHDIVGAHQNGLPCVAVMFGYGSAEEFAEHGADYVVEDVPALRRLLMAPAAT